MRFLIKFVMQHRWAAIALGIVSFVAFSAETRCGRKRSYRVIPGPG